MSLNPMQGTSEWFNERCGCLTASRMADALDYRKDGTPGAKRRALIIELLAERMTGESAHHYVSAPMQWGIDKEPEARAAYQAETGNLVRLVGFVPHPEIEFCGASPDGLIDGDGLVEIKCPTTETHLKWVLEGKVPDEYKPQMLLQLSCTRRQWCDFVSYDPRIKNQDRRLFVRRYVPTEEERANNDAAARALLAEVEREFDRITELA